jgi:nucleotide-binding universal stress UspA family protein
MFLKRILIPVDFSARSRAALRYAVELARQTGAEIVLLHVVPPPSGIQTRIDAYVGLPLPRVPAHVLDDARARLETLRTSIDHEGVCIGSQVEVGDPAASIVQVATDGTHDLIVVGTRGRAGLSDLLLGSVAKRLLSCAPCPVVTLRANSEPLPSL